MLQYESYHPLLYNYMNMIHHSLGICYLPYMYQPFCFH
nr:MAG TPA: hypothetical protein [Caudoviricetes sp.]DAY99598.1 MAG TPA: hypothetical protein [Caudoviricetes sp.]